ncbi:hypothetical protein R3P38DRAFT_3423827 [Favolaschia claudopus]|uniref:Uncharacterized protein n=1 Tax=Favolaschia claudopus TaxID=2862362 RepID=A0AAW0D7Q1_9AGAR
MSSPVQLLEHAELAELFVLLADARTTNALARNFEHIINFPDEFQLIWKSRPSIFKYLYVPFSESALIVNIVLVMTKTEWSDDTCHTFLFVELVAGALMILLSDLVLVFRVWILYRRSKLFMYFLAGHLTASISMFILTAYKCGSTILAFGHRNAPILSIFMRDGFFWFLSLVVLRVAKIIIWNRGRVTLVEIPVVVVSGETAVGTELEVRRAAPASKGNWETSHDLD